MTKEATKTAETEEDRQLVRSLARAIWLSQKKAGGDAADPGSEEMRAAWDADKADMVRVANMTIRRLDAKGIALVQK